MKKSLQDKGQLGLVVGLFLFRSLVGGKGRPQGLIAHGLQDGLDRLGTDGLLGLGVHAVLVGLFLGGRAVLEGQVELSGGLVEGGQVRPGKEETPLALDVVLGHGRLDQNEPHAKGPAEGLDREGVVLQRLGGLDVVHVACGPVEEDLLAVVGHGVGLGGPVAAAGDEVAVLVVAGEEVVQVVEDLGLAGLGGLGGLETPALFLVCVHKTLDDLDGAGAVLLPDLAGGTEGVGGNLLLDLLRKGLDLALQGGPLLTCEGGEGLVHLTGQLLAQERLYLAALQVQQAVDAEVQVRAVELEHLP